MRRPSPNVSLTEDQIRSFRENGFLSLPPITSSEEVNALRATFTRLFAGRAGMKEGAYFDMMSVEETEKPVSPQILDPINYAPELRYTQFRANVKAIARQLLGEEAGISLEHVIVKPARYGAPTPWHQDAAHDPRIDKQCSIWMPLQEATVENGCMHFIPGSHLEGIYEHASPNNDVRIHCLETQGEFGREKAVPCPVPAGGASIHDARVLHYAGPNRSDGDRFAYVIVCNVLRKGKPKERQFRWMAEKQTTRIARELAWQSRGGRLIEAARKLRKALYDPKRAAIKLRRLSEIFLKRA